MEVSWLRFICYEAEAGINIHIVLQQENKDGEIFVHLTVYLEKLTLLHFPYWGVHPQKQNVGKKLKA